MNTRINGYQSKSLDLGTLNPVFYIFSAYLSWIRAQQPQIVANLKWYSDIFFFYQIQIHILNISKSRRFVPFVKSGCYLFFYGAFMALETRCKNLGIYIPVCHFFFTLFYFWLKKTQHSDNATILMWYLYI